jgi:hypothetical protein
LVKIVKSALFVSCFVVSLAFGASGDAQKEYKNRAVAHFALKDYKNASKDARKSSELGSDDTLLFLRQEKLLDE